MTINDYFLHLDFLQSDEIAQKLKERIELRLRKINDLQAEAMETSNIENMEVLCFQAQEAVRAISICNDLLALYKIWQSVAEKKPVKNQIFYESFAQIRVEGMLRDLFAENKKD